MENKIKLFKKNNKIVKIELNGQSLKGVTNIKINNDYTTQETKESVIVEISNISSLEIVNQKE